MKIEDRVQKQHSWYRRTRDNIVGSRRGSKGTIHQQQLYGLRRSISNMPPPGTYAGTSMTAPTSSTMSNSACRQEYLELMGRCVYQIEWPWVLVGQISRRSGNSLVMCWAQNFQLLRNLRIRARMIHSFAIFVGPGQRLGDERSDSRWSNTEKVSKSKATK